MTAWLDSKTVERFHADLAEIPTLYALLPAILTGIKTGASGVHYPPGSKPPLSVQVVNLLDTQLKDAALWRETDPRDTDVLDRYGIVPRIALWVRLVGDEADEAGEHPFSLDDDEWCNIGILCQALKMATSWIITQQWVTELAEDVGKITAELRSTLGIRPEFRPKCRWCAYRCVPQDGGTWFLCPNCGADYTWQGEVAALLAVQDMTGPDCAAQLGIRWDRIRKWKSLGLVKTIGSDRHGRDLFSLDAVARVYRSITDGKIRLTEGA